MTAKAEKCGFEIIKKSNAQNNQFQIEAIEQAVRNIRYGTITIHIENGKIVQFDALEKHRFV